MSKNPYAQYQVNSKNAMTERQIESTVLSKAALLLNNAKEDMDNQELLTHALEYNKLLWTILVTDVSDETNKLPQEIKINILTLGNFVFKRIVDLQYAPKADGLDILISINRNLASGLSH
jgi:flagellar biosynthesis activator protein FlaF